MRLESIPFSLGLTRIQLNHRLNPPPPKLLLAHTVLGREDALDEALRAAGAVAARAALWEAALVLGVDAWAADMQVGCILQNQRPTNPVNLRF